MRTVCIVAVSAASLFTTGCLSDVHRGEQMRFRKVLLTMYEAQAMDNLIRTYHHRPIVQMAYKGITGTIKDTGSTTFGGSQTDAAGIITNVFSYGATGSRENGLAVTADPIVDGGRLEKRPGKADVWVPSIYQAYIDFVWSPTASARAREVGAGVDAFPRLGVPRSSPSQADIDRLSAQLDRSSTTRMAKQAPRTTRLMCTAAEPAADAYHVKQRYQDTGDRPAKWYWVPVEWKEDYFNLVLRVTVGLTPSARESALPEGVLRELRLDRLGM